jgi:hypothetical protein
MIEYTAKMGLRCGACYEVTQDVPWFFCEPKMLDDASDSDFQAIDRLIKAFKLD